MPQEKLKTRETKFTPLQRLEMINGLRNLGSTLDYVGRLEACLRYVEEHVGSVTAMESITAKEIEGNLYELLSGLQEHNRTAVNVAMNALKRHTENIFADKAKEK